MTRVKKYYVVKEWVKIPYSRHGYYADAVRSKKDKYEDAIEIKATSIDEAKEKWAAIQKGINFSEQIKKLYPNANIFLINEALKENFSKRGITFEMYLNGEELTKETIYSVYLSHLRHTETNYDSSACKGDDHRWEWNSSLHDIVKTDLGIE